MKTAEKGFTCEIIDIESYKNTENKELFEAIRNSMLEIFPNVTDKLAIEAAENFAKVLQPAIEKLIQKEHEYFEAKLKELETSVGAAAAASSSNPAPVT